AVLPDVPCAIVEDAAQSIGAGPPRGIAAAISFFPTKNLGALGDAGAIVTDDAALAERLRVLRNQGARAKHDHTVIGGNFRLDALRAAGPRQKLGPLGRWPAARRAHASRYRELLAARAPLIRVPADAPGHVYHQFVIRTPRRDELRGFLAA